MSKKSDKSRLSVTLTTAYLDGLKHLIEVGVYLDNQDGIRAGMRQLFRFHGIAPFAQQALTVKAEEKE